LAKVTWLVIQAIPAGQPARTSILKLELVAAQSNLFSE
jgi:hypothetical protein